jgi:uncharacterized membrane protein YagU involved in acid resistance
MDDGDILVMPRNFDRIAAGMLAGMVAGIPMILALCIGYAVMGRPFFMPIKLISAVLTGDAAMFPDAGVVFVIVGLIVHLICSGVFGGLFGTITLTQSRVRLTAWSVIFSVTLWWFMQFIFLPTGGLDFPLASRMPPGLFALGHLIFGITMSSVLLPIEQRIRRRDLETEPVSPSTPAEAEVEAEKSEHRAA